MKKIGLIALTLVLALGAMGAGIAYFTDTAPVYSTFTTGSIDVMLSEDDGTYYDSLTWSSPEAWNPGETCKLDFWVRNYGDCSAKILALDAQDLVESNWKKAKAEPSGSASNLADYIVITRIDATDPSGTYMGIPMSVWADAGPAGSKMDANGDTFVTLREFVNWPYSCKFWTSTVPGPWPQAEDYPDYLDPLGANYQWVVIEFLFHPSAGNDYQWDKCTVTFKAVGANNADNVWIISP